MFSVRGSLKMYFTVTGPFPLLRLANCSRSCSHFSCSKPLRESTRDVFGNQKQETVCELCFKSVLTVQRTAAFLNHKTNNFFVVEKSNLTPPLGPRILLLFLNPKIDLDTVNDTTVSDSPQWSQFESQVGLSLTKCEKDSPHAEVYKQTFLDVTSEHQNYVQILTDGSEVDEKVAAAAAFFVAPNSPFSRRLRDHSSIFTAEL